MDVLTFDRIVGVGVLEAPPCVGYNFDHNIEQVTASPRWDGLLELGAWCTRCSKYMTYAAFVDTFAGRITCKFEEYEIV